VVHTTSIRWLKHTIEDAAEWKSSIEEQAP